MEPEVILLNGPSSSGKSTLAKALRALISEKGLGRYEIVSIDDFLRMSPDEAIYEDDVYRISNDLCGAAAQILRSGSGAIIDHVITSERIYARLREALSPYPMRTVLVTCPARVLRQRELERGDRCPGSAEASAEYLYPKEGYDLVIDTGEGSPGDNSLTILNSLFRSADDRASAQTPDTQ